MPRFALYGRTRTIVAITVPQAALAGATGATLAVCQSLGFQFDLESAQYVATVAHAGAGATQTIRIRKGNATGVTAASVALTVGDLGTMGNSKAIPVTKGNASFSDADTLSVTIDTGGVAFTAAGGELILVLRERPQRVA